MQQAEPYVQNVCEIFGDKIIYTSHQDREMGFRRSNYFRRFFETFTCYCSYNCTRSRFPCAVQTMLLRPRVNLAMARSNDGVLLYQRCHLLFLKSPNSTSFSLNIWTQFQYFWIVDDGYQYSHVLVLTGCNMALDGLDPLKLIKQCSVIRPIYFGRSSSVCWIMLSQFFMHF